MIITLGVPKELKRGERRVAVTPEVVKKIIKLGIKVQIEKGAGDNAGFPDTLYNEAGATLGSANEALAQGIVWKVAPPTMEQANQLTANSLLISFLEPGTTAELLQLLASRKVNSLAMEWLPRTSRAQSMDALSSQANIAGYRAVLEAAAHFQRFFPMMMTSAGMARPAKVVVLGVGVAGLQAIATARRLGAQVEAFDVRPEVKEQILSLGAKCIEINLNEAGSGSGGYAKALSADTQAMLMDALAGHLAKADIVITTANIPGKRAPILISEAAVKGMRAGSVIIDMAAGNGGNCPLSQADTVIQNYGVTLIGHTNYPSMLAADASHFYAQNLWNLTQLMLRTDKTNNTLSFAVDLNDDILAASLATWQGELRKK